MSDRTPTLQQLLKALNKLKNWFVFGAILGVPVSQLKEIESSHSQGELERCKIDLLQYWINNELTSTWNEVILALEQTDHLALAAQIKFDYLLSASGSEEEGTLPPSGFLSHDPLPMISAPASYGLPPPTSTPTHSSAFPTYTDEIAAEIRADMTVVSNLKELEKSFGRMLVQVRRHLENCELSEALLFLNSSIGSDKCIGCNSFSKVLRHLQRNQHIDVFNISVLQQLVACFDNLELTEVIEDYNQKKESFLKQTTVLDFQRAIVSRVEPILASGKAVITIKIPEELASCRTLRDIGKLAMEGFEECHKKFICLHAELGSSIISWIFPKELSGRLEQLAYDNAAVLEDNRVMEVKIGGRRVFPCTQQEDMASQGASEKEEEEKSKLQQLYTVFYPQLVEAVSDLDTCHSLTTQLHSTSLLSEEKKTVLSSSLASGRSFLKVLGVEEEPHLVTVLMEKMVAVKQLQTLSEDMSGWLSGSKQGAADTDQLIEKQAYYENIERLQLETDIERLTSDKADLLTRLQYYEEDLRRATELLRLREKAISGMMAAVRRSDADVEETEERISYLKKELEELRREGVKSGGRESGLIEEVEELKSKLMTKTDELNEAIKSNSELSSQLMFTTHGLEESRRWGLERENLLTKEIEDLKSKLTDELNEPIELNSELSSQRMLTYELEESKREEAERESMLTKELQSKLRTKTDELNEAIKRNSESCQLVEARKKEILVQSGGRESQLAREIEDLKGKLMTKTDELYEAFKTSSSELSSQLLHTTLEEWKRYVYERQKCVSDVAVQTKQEPVLLPPGWKASNDDFFYAEKPGEDMKLRKDETKSSQLETDNISIQLLLIELKDVVDDWEVFGASLGVPDRQLECIKKDDPHGGVKTWKLKMFRLLFQNKGNISWNDVVQALRHIDYLDLAEKLEKKYSTQIKEEKQIQEKVLILKNFTVVEKLKALERSFDIMLINFKCLIVKCTGEFSSARSLLKRWCGSKKFEQCENYEQLIHQLSESYIDSLNIEMLKCLANVSSVKKELNKIIAEYEMEKEEFLQNTTVVQFMQAVVERVEPILQKDEVHVTIMIDEHHCCCQQQTLKDIEILTKKGFKDERMYFVRMHAKRGSIIISWVFPEAHLCELRKVAKENVAVFKDSGVEEVTIGSKVVFSCTQEEVTKLKEIYTDYYHLHLVEAVPQLSSQSLLTQLISIALIMSVKFTCTRASDSLRIFGQEEEHHILAPFTRAMSRDEQLKLLQEHMTAVWMSKKVQQQLTTVANIKRLTSEREDLLTKLQYCENNLKTAIESFETRSLSQA